VSPGTFRMSIRVIKLSMTNNNIHICQPIAGVLILISLDLRGRHMWPSLLKPPCPCAQLRTIANCFLSSCPLPSASPVALRNCRPSSSRRATRCVTGNIIIQYVHALWRLQMRLDCHLKPVRIDIRAPFSSSVAAMLRSPSIAVASRLA
jgi:hypothetical protein